MREPFQKGSVDFFWREYKDNFLKSSPSKLTGNHFRTKLPIGPKLSDEERTVSRRAVVFIRTGSIFQRSRSVPTCNPNHLRDCGAQLEWTHHGICSSTSDPFVSLRLFALEIQRRGAICKPPRLVISQTMSPPHGDITAGFFPARRPGLLHGRNA